MSLEEVAALSLTNWPRGRLLPDSRQPQQPIQPVGFLDTARFYRRGWNIRKTEIEIMGARASTFACVKTQYPAPPAWHIHCSKP